MASLLARFRTAVTDAASLRSWTVDANDGIIATAGVLEGFAGAGASDATLLTAAIVATVAGGLGLGGAKWSEEAAEREAQLRVAREEAAQLELSPDEEVAELAGYYERKGLTPDLALQVAEQLTAADALGAQLEAEHGIREVMSRAAPVWAGVTATAAFVLGALVPLLITILVPGRLEAWAVLLAAIVSLILTSIVSARSGGTGVLRTIARSLTVGVGTLGASYLAGLLIF
ncbi:VIT1/CCC1 transporter family protein [Leifsonia naganoensis]|uniref:VIT1/CCC1 family predicted Fe2+/Mn2+ transporter n=1 Tax=Leifsonia naganoensis TaxID=150025 RepID=A0A853DTT5_9MICO|nr:VIT1/CCC1 transporter family protein [Leifsonia naganoensis]NYK09490.1 VIT1/CCC1 family predicted Fe2+/Mn2+ transporter [Leifsonia naganoensis]